MNRRTKKDEYSRREPLTRQLFNPHSDHPIGFNKPKELPKEPEKVLKKPVEDTKRKQCKLLISALHKIEADIDHLSQPTQDALLTRKETSVRRREKGEVDWKEKMRLHMALGYKYLDILQCDPDYAEKKGLIGLCWKRAFYTLVEQFRCALKEDEHVLALFMQYLDQVDQFYQQLTLFLKSMETENDKSGLRQWKRTRRYKWYICLSYRADIARYRWAYCPESMKQKALEEAWKHYSQGVWVMPDKGNLYFNLSLLMQRKDNPPGYEFHKLYWSIRSLMVRRNEFLNAREGLLVLFETNRCCVQSLKKKSMDTTVPYLIRLHGLLFTKIGLDEFSRIKRLFFDSLFSSTHSKQTSSSGLNLFWFETIVLSISALYNYDYPNSSLHKLLIQNKARYFHSSHDEQEYQKLLDQMKDTIQFSYGIDIMIQMAVELMQRYLNSQNPPETPKLPSLPCSEEPVDENGWFVYIEILLHWMSISGICLDSLWDTMIGTIAYDFLPQFDHVSKISSSFWPLLIQFLNRLMSELEQDKYDLINTHFMEQEQEDKEKRFVESVTGVMGVQPELPEEHHLRGLGWVDEVHSRMVKLSIQPTHTSSDQDIEVKRKMKILEYGFVLIKQLHHVFHYNPVEEMIECTHDIEVPVSEQEEIPVRIEEEPAVSLEEMEDVVLLSNETEISDDDDDRMTQLKKRREQLQSMITSAQSEKQYGFRRLPVGRLKEREVRLEYLRERIIPGKTILVLDTNCFIGYMDQITKLFASRQWSIIVPLVVVTELDGLKGNAQRLGVAATQAIQLIETTLANKPKSSPQLRIQTSHHNLMHDIKIRSEQFTFGETDKNLDDLVLSVCLWWQQNSVQTAAPVCLVTGDRNLSVKARARDVEVVPVSAIMQLTPK
ncbi:hypothetical protein BDB01DRAFT_907930 [Pilobolus umbonatus]|nr:hypothetical protein BDB01DRAFT_907930 [Pilobolus umbonatus]